MKPANYNFFRGVIKELQRLAAAGGSQADIDDKVREGETLLEDIAEGPVAQMCDALESVAPERGRRARQRAVERFESWAQELRSKSDEHINELVSLHDNEFGPFSESRISEALESFTPGYARCFLYIAEKRRRAASP